MGDNGSISPEELGILGESEIELKSNGVCHVEDVNDKLLSPVTKRHGLRKWRRIPRELVKSPNGNSAVSNGFHVDSELGDESGPASRADSDNSGDSDISIRSSDQKRNGQTGKKARGLKIEKENSDSNMGNFVFVQGTKNSVASKAKDDEEYSDDALLADKHSNDVPESEDVSHEDVPVDEEKIEKHDTSNYQDALVESITRFDSAIDELEREMRKWKDIGKEDDPLTFDDSIDDILEVKDVMIKELESAITMGDTKIDDLLKEKIQAEVEIEAITTTTQSLITGPLNEMKLNLQQNMTETENVEIKEDVKDVQNKVVKEEKEEDVKKLQNGVCRLSLCLLIQIILLFVTFYLEIPSQKVELVPT